MSESARVKGTLASNATIHPGAELIGTEPLAVRTSESPWSYAVWLPLELPADTGVIVEATVRVVRGSVAVGCADAELGSVADEIIVRKSKHAVRLQFLPDTTHGAYLLFRTGSKPGPATVEIHSLESRPFNASERASLAALPTLQPTPRWSRYYSNRIESVVARARLHEYLRLNAPVRRPWLEGLSVMVHPRDQLSRALYVSGLYEPNTAIALKRLLEPGATFFDVGAHAGIFSLLGSRYVGDAGRVFSFEPSPRERARLEQHVSINALANVAVIPAAIGGHDGRAMLSVAADEYSGLNTLGERFAYAVERAEVVEVDVITLDTFVARAGVQRLDVIKLDIEGAECAALRGAATVLREMRPALVIELVSAALQANGTTPEELELVLRDASYTFYEIDDESAGLRQVDSLAGLDEQNFVALPKPGTPAEV